MIGFWTKLIVSSLALSLLAGVAGAQIARQMSPDKRADILKLMELTNVSQQIGRPPNNFRTRLQRDL